MRRILCGSAALFILALAPAAMAQSWPTKPLKVVIPFAPGGAVDSTGRVIGAKLQEILGQPVIIENKPGVGGNLAADSVAKSDPDGHTILQTTVGQAMSPSLYKQLPYNPEKDLIPVTQLVETGLLLVATPKLEANDLKEFIALAKAKPGVLNYGNTGVGNPLHLAMEMLKRDTGIDVQAVPFRGDAPLNTALISGDVQVAVVPVATALALIEAKQIKALAVTTPKRIPRLPDLLTVAEQGVKDFSADSWQGFFLPAGTPPAIVTRLYETTKQALSTPEVIARMKAFASEVIASTPAEFAAKYKADSAKYAAIIKQANIPLQ
jgi:tripartite-type tricarboxylate transporter receptor subunit TctC